MPIYADPTVDYSRHKGRVDFEAIRESGNSDWLMEYVEAFIARGHDPTDPKDSMYAIMGITPEYLDFMKHDFEEKAKLGNQAGKPKQPLTQSNAPVQQQAHGGKRHGKGFRNTFSPEDD